MLAATVTAMSTGTALMPCAWAACSAIGAMSTAVTVFDMKNVSSDVATYMAAISKYVPPLPVSCTSACDTSWSAPVFSSAVDIGSIAPNSTMLSQLIVL